MSVKKGVYYSAFLVFAVAFAFILGSYFTNVPALLNPSSSNELSYRGHVCVYKNGELVECSHNVLYGVGQNLSRDILGIGGNSILNISLCNATLGCGTPVAAASEDFNIIALCGLQSIPGTYSPLQNAGGNWSVY